MNIAISVDTRQVDRMVLRLRGLETQLRLPAGAMRTVAEGVELQTRVRIQREKTSPDGAPWRPWSKAYARTRKAHHSLLIDTAHMVDESFEHDSSATLARIWSTAIYAGKNNRQRPFLGLSAANARDIEGWLAPLLEHMAQEAMAGR